jgi:hypothetical protein
VLVALRGSGVRRSLSAARVRVWRARLFGRKSGDPGRRLITNVGIGLMLDACGIENRLGRLLETAASNFKLVDNV